MAQQRSGQRRSSSSRNTGKRRPSQTTRKKAAPQSDASIIADFYSAFKQTRAFRPVATIFIITLIVLLDLLFAWNYYDRFFFLLGLELIIVAGIWVIGLLLSISATPSPERSET
ncbi:MAG: hypothetical protein IKT14_07540 [Clostridiales bacterium]|nr:hypothetical protein [Clostridiales bacterium]